MSILLSTIDCPFLTETSRQILFQRYSIRTTIDFIRWKNQTNESNRFFSETALNCVETCLIAHTASLVPRTTVDQSHFDHYQLNFSLFDRENLLRRKRHLIFIYEFFNQHQWNEWFNRFLVRLFTFNPTIKMKYFNGNASLFDLNHFYSHYCSSNEILRSRRDDLFEKSFFFQPSLHLDHLEKSLTEMENDDHQESIQVLIVDDLFSLIRPYLSVEHRIRYKICQLTRRFNRLAQQRSLLIINGLILPTQKSSTSTSQIHRTRVDCFQADNYVFFQSLCNNENEIQFEIIGKVNRTSKFNLEHWAKTDVN